MDSKYYIPAITLTIGLVLGRYSLPFRKLTETASTDVKQTSQASLKDTDDHTVKTVTVTHKPDGTVTTQTVIRKDVQTETKTVATANDTKHSDTKTEVVYDNRKTTVSGLAVTNLANPTSLSYGVIIQERILGPVSVGALGTTSGMFGVTLGVTF